MEEIIPEEDGYYWVRLGKHNMNRVYTQEHKFYIVELTSRIVGKKNKRYIDITEVQKSFTLDYFKKNAVYGMWIPINNPNKEF